MDNAKSEHHTNIYEFLQKYANCEGDHLISARDYEILAVRYTKIFLTTKHGRWQKPGLRPPYFQIAQQGSISLTKEGKYERIVKMLIQQEPGDWENFTLKK